MYITKGYILDKMLMGRSTRINTQRTEAVHCLRFHFSKEQFFSPELKLLFKLYFFVSSKCKSNATNVHC